MNIKILSKDHGTSAAMALNEIIQTFQKKKQRRHELRILSCYVDLDLLENYIGYLLKSIRITEVYFAFNFSEIYKIGPVDTKIKLQLIQDNLKKKGVVFEWKALTSSKLVHTKGYAIIQRSNSEISDCVTLTTSANFTEPGFSGGNIELGHFSTSKKDVRDFEKVYNYLWEKVGCEIDSAVFKHGDYLLKFALLSSGFFLHKWSGNLSQHLGIKYELTETAKVRGSIAPELVELGFEAGDTFTRQVIKLGNLPKKEVPHSFISRFTIETFWGRWCPSDAWSTLSDTFEGSEKFIEEFQTATEDETLQKIKTDALNVQKQLIKQGLIRKVGADHLDRWVSKIQQLRLNSRRLERFFSGYEAHNLPYTIEQKSDVIELFESLEEAIDLSKATNIAKEKVLSAMNGSNPSLVRLTNEEIGIVKEMQNSR